MRISTLSTLCCVLLRAPAHSFTVPTQHNRHSSHQFAVHVQDPVSPPSLLDPIEEATLDDLAEAPAVVSKRKGPTFQTWTRRLVTKQDKFSLHKISNAGFVVSSIALLAGMLIPNEQGQFFQEIPSWLGPFDSMFVLSTVVQSMVAIPMVLKHRKADHEVGKTQIEMGLQSMLLALYSSWESPFCSSFLEDHWKLIFGSLILGIASLDFEAAFADYDTIQNRMRKIGVKEVDSLVEKVGHFFCFRAQFLIGSLANLIFLANMVNPAHDRLDWIHMIETGYALPFCSGADVPLIYFTTVLTATIISYQSLLATLSNKKLIPADTATKIISGSTGVIAVGLTQLLFARSLYG